MKISFFVALSSERKFALVDFHDYEVEIVQTQDIVTDRDRKL